MDEREAMARALDLAWRGWGRVQPNPLVGAVVLREGELVGEGWHPEFGDRHAEALALAGAGERARGATMVVTLEPWAHQGKQPPCTDAIIQSGIRRVVAAIPDPNPVAAHAADRGPQLTLVRTANETPTTIVVSPGAEAARVRRLETAGVTLVRSSDISD